MTSSLPPALVMILAGLLLPLTPRTVRNAGMLLAPLVALALVWMVPDGPALTVTFLGHTLTPLKGDALSRVFATVFTLMAFTGVLYAYRQARTIELAAALVYAGGAVGVSLAGDLVTVFIYWELMALGSTTVLWAAGTDSSYRAAMRYLMVHLFGGVVLMAGVVGWVLETGSVDFGPIELSSVSSWLILIGFLINAGAPPLSAWLPMPIRKPRHRARCSCRPLPPRPPSMC